jgi:hypothetical protein
MADLSPYQTEHLFLLIGTNPLPNYVAARLLAKAEGHLYLVHSRETDIVADRLREALRRPRESATKIRVDDSDAHNIYEQVRTYAAGKSSVGLNYTGGTKTMAVHAHRAVCEVNPEAVFSYLNTNLQLLIEQPQAWPKRIPVGTAVDVYLDALLKMHGVTFDRDRVCRDSMQLGLCTALADLHTTEQGVSTWYEWRRKGSKCWTVLPEGQPGLETVERALCEMCGGSKPTAGAVARALGFDRLSSCAGWFRGDWLEHYTLHHLKRAIEQRDDVHDYAMNLKCRQAAHDGATEFQFDLAAMRGHQLFAISCIASYKKAPCKEHLFEAYVRARQMGGDEARVALVCAHPRPPELLAEIERPWDAVGKLRVFGAPHLLNLADHLQDWFDSQP